MTYREAFQARSDQAHAQYVHIGHCPDKLMPDLTGTGFRCISLDASIDLSCRACWDREIIPQTEEEPSHE